MQHWTEAVRPILDQFAAMQKQAFGLQSAERSAQWWLGMLAFSGGMDSSAAVDKACAQMQAQLPEPQGFWAAALFRRLYSI